MVDYYRDEKIDHSATEEGNSWKDYASRKEDSGDCDTGSREKRHVRVRRGITDHEARDEFARCNAHELDFVSFVSSSASRRTIARLILQGTSCADYKAAMWECQLETASRIHQLKRKFTLNLLFPYQDEGLAGTLRRQSSGSVATRLSVDDVWLQLVR